MTHEHTDDRTGPPRDTLADVDHTNPHTDDAFGDTMAYDRGRTLAVDGGERGGAPRADPDAREGDDEDEDEETDAGGELRDVDHTPPGDADDTHNVYERGHEGRERREEDA